MDLYMPEWLLLREMPERYLCGSLFYIMALEKVRWEVVAAGGGGDFVYLSCKIFERASEVQKGIILKERFNHWCAHVEVELVKLLSYVFNFVISGEPIKQKSSIKYLGVHIDNKLK